MAILSLGQSVSEQGTKIATIISQHHNYRTFHPFSIFSHPITSRGTDSSAVVCRPVRVTHLTESERAGNLINIVNIFRENSLCYQALMGLSLMLSSLVECYSGEGTYCEK